MYINHYPIPSWNYNGQTLICAEDLQNYGFEVKWNEYKQTLNITRNDSTTISPVVTFRPKQSLIGQNQFMLKSTNVTVWYWNNQLTSYGGLDGYTLINVADLSCINNVSVDWVPSVNAVKVWVTDGLEMQQNPWNVRVLDWDMSVYTTCNPPSGYHYNANYLGNNEMGFLSYAMCDYDSGVYCDCPYGRLTVTDVIDANGNSRKLDGSSCVKSDYADFSYYPYFYGLTDDPVAGFLIIDSSDLTPATASEPGGIIKYQYQCLMHGIDVEGQIRVDQLPD